MNYLFLEVVWKNIVDFLDGPLNIALTQLNKTVILISMFGHVISKSLQLKISEH